MSSGDKPAVRVIKETAHLLAGTVAIAAVFSDPQLIVLGGSIGSRPELVDRIAEGTARLTPRPVEIRSSALGNRASMIGAVSMAVTHLHEELFGVTDLQVLCPCRRRNRRLREKPCERKERVARKAERRARHDGRVGALAQLDPAPKRHSE